MDTFKDQKKDGESHINTRFDDLMQNFSCFVEKKINEDGFRKEAKVSEVLLLNTTFPKYAVEPLEKYLCISPDTRLNALYECLRPYDIVVGKVTSIIGSHLAVVLSYIVDGQRRHINDLNIVATVESSESSKSSMDDEDVIKIGDKVKGVVTHVNRTDRKIGISLEERHLGISQIRHFPLGKLNADSDEDTNCDEGIHDDSHFVDTKAYIRDLESSSDFVDPHSIKRLLNILKLPEQCTSFLRIGFPVTINESVEVMREKQSAKWSMDMVGVGVKHFREQRLKEAMKCFDQSISFYPKNVEAYVARGALKANKNELKEAVDDFREALKLNPKHRNAKKYIIETLTTIAKRYEKEMRWKEASSYYKDILDLDPDNKDALKQFNQIKQVLLPKKDDPTTKSKPKSPDKPKTLSLKSKERINKLKELLEAETQRDDDSSSSSSSSSSDSDSSSDDGWVEKTDDVWVEKKKDGESCASSNKKRRRESSSFDKSEAT